MRPLLLLYVLCACAGAELIDRIAIVVDHSIIKDSDIDQDVRLTQFLNRQPLHLTPAERKAAANRLIEQKFLRDEIRSGGYQNAAVAEANRQLNQLFPNPAVLSRQLADYGLTEEQLRRQFRWQLTVLSFIDARFRPAAVVDDAAVEAYYKKHAAQLRSKDPKAEARSLVTDEEVNRLFFSFLDERRKQAVIRYHEEGLGS